MGALLYLIVCALVGYAATNYNRSPVGWFLFSAVFSPIVGMLLLLLVGRK
ncbi:hypothetical protein VspSw1_75 [Vibrio phage VspSw_1]|uniref:Uncharacterized protein n=1 Tax=Vibrio phage VspSw_1 TaxID=2484249 RepID=A0A411BKI0_9CAUD|nr:hypothetical protein HOV08_gp075 [Vibrio phage VspSw_1]QAY02147.1 hypothetical protein VspSw1_75 [Vibrio phage VspSw_1]